LGWTVFAGEVTAQTDYFNTDAGRPVRIEDAYATERYAFELKLAPVRLERFRGGEYHWSVEPEIAYVILPRTHVEVGLSVAAHDRGDLGTQGGIAGLELSALHNLNTETRLLPALALRADLLLPAGSMSPDEPYASVSGIMTRSFRFGRVHINGQYTMGPTPGTSTTEPAEARWLAGAAIDKAFPLRAFLIIADVYATQPLHKAQDIVWNAGAGIRYQLNPRFAMDAGLARRLTGDRTWSFTFGTAYAFAVRSLIP
jgi:hypothetical protein